MECRRTNPQSSMPTSPSHTPHPHALTQSRWTPGPSPTSLDTLCVHRPWQGYTHNPTGLPVLSQRCTYNPVGLPVPVQGCTLTQIPNQDAPQNLSPPSQETARPSVCAGQVRSSIPGIFVALWPTCVLLPSCLATSAVRSLGGACVVFPHPGSSWF